MILRCLIGLCILFHLISCQGHRNRNVRIEMNRNDGIGFGYPESEEDNPSKQNALVSANSFRMIVFHPFFCAVIAVK